ncbi:MAG: T9SS type A sorting domain-containing protein [Bacteroidota bacterium]
MKKLLLILFLFFSFYPAFSQFIEGEGLMPQDSCFLDTTCHLIVLDSANQSVWHIGKPNKTFFNQSYSPTNSILTDSLNPYPPNTNAYFDVLIPPFNGLSSVISFWHKYDTDSMKDGGYLEVSHDKGLSWINLAYEAQQTPYVHVGGENLYDQKDTLLGGIPGFSGKSDWIETRYQWVFNIPVKTEFDTTILRFHFISDSSDSGKEGWMVDDIRIFFEDFAGSVSPGIDKVNIEIAPHPIHTETQITFDNYTRKALRLELLDLQGKAVYVKEGIRESHYHFQRGNLSAGIYLLRLRDKSEILATQKLLLMDP